MTLTQVYDGDKLVGLADATQTPSDPPLTKLEKETLRLWREHQQQAEQIEELQSTVALFNSMILSGERHSNVSRARLESAMQTKVKVCKEVITREA